MLGLSYVSAHVDEAALLMGIESIFKCSNSIQPCPFLYLASHSQFLPPHLPLPAAHPSRDSRGALLRMTTLDRLIAAHFHLLESTVTPDCRLAARGSDLTSESHAFAQKHSSDPDPTFDCPILNFCSPPVNETRNQAMLFPAVRSLYEHLAHG